MNNLREEHEKKISDLNLELQDFQKKLRRETKNREDTEK